MKVFKAYGTSYLSLRTCLAWGLNSPAYLVEAALVGARDTHSSASRAEEDTLGCNYPSPCAERQNKLHFTTAEPFPRAP